MLRQVELHEIPLFTAMGEEFYLEAGAPGKFNPEHFTNFWATAINQEFGVIHGLFNEEGKPFGALGAVLLPDTHTGDLVANELFWFVTKPARGMIGLSLLDRFEDWAREQGAKRINMVHLNDKMGTLLERLYTSRDYIKFEVHYIREI